MRQIALEIAPVLYGSMGMYRYASNLLSPLLEQRSHDQRFLLYGASPRKRNRRGVESLPYREQAQIKLLPFPPRVFEALRHLSPLLCLEQFLGDVDLVHTQFTTMHPPCRRAGLVVAVHGISPLRTPEHYPAAVVHAYERQVRHMLSMADVIVALTEDNRQAMVEILGVPASCIRVIPSGIGEEFRPGRDEDTVSALGSRGLAVGRYVLYTGNLGPHKNIRLLLEAYAKLPAALRAEHELVLAGPGDPGALGWRSLAAELGIESHLRWLGHVTPPDIATLMRGACLFTFPSFCEGFALPPLEAMASGLPVIVSNASSLPETVGDGGLHLSPHAPEEWAAVMERLLADEASRSDLSRKALLRAQQFSWRATARATLDLYDDLLAGGLAAARDAWPKRERGTWGGLRRLSRRATRHDRPTTIQNVTLGRR